jgi:hypothetical protein
MALPPSAQRSASGNLGADKPSGGGGGGGDGGGISGAVGDAIGSAAGGVAGGLFAAMIAPIQLWVNSIESGFAHTLDVILNNLWYGAIAFAGFITMTIGMFILWRSSPIGKAATDAAMTVAQVAAVA